MSNERREEGKIFPPNEEVVSIIQEEHIKEMMRLIVETNKLIAETNVRLAGIMTAVHIRNK